MKNPKSLIILGIETSCDETAASVVKAEENKISVLSDIVSSQSKLHSRWGGVVPNLAAREHLKNIVPVLELALKKARVSTTNIDLIAVTQGPGLIPSLLVGTSAAKTLSYIWQKPLIGIHHIEGHIYANFIDVNSKSQISSFKQSQSLKLKIKNSAVKFPILCLVVSGGHTQLILMQKHLNYKIIGETLDDAAGEAFDKTARILNLGYPGGPIVAAQAAKFRALDYKFKISLPRPMISSHDLNFSFSGLKTAVLYETKKHQDSKLKNKKINLWKKFVTAISAEFQQSVMDVLIHKTFKAAKIYKPKTIMLAGGVSANDELRKQMDMKIKKELPNTSYLIPDISYSIDNAAMIAAAAVFRWREMSSTQKKEALKNWKKIQPNANLELK